MLQNSYFKKYIHIKHKINLTSLRTIFNQTVDDSWHETLNEENLEVLFIGPMGYLRLLRFTFNITERNY